MTSSTQLCLGTVQFGLPYGITNETGQVSEHEVRRILELAVVSGISLFDTAQAYGVAEKVLGLCWPKGAFHKFISKLPAGAPRDTWEANFMTSLERLQASKLSGLLLHRAADLLGPDGGALLSWLEGLRDRGLVDCIGVSIYESSELEGLPLDRFQLVQLPLSVYDQRLILDGTVDMLKSLGIDIHARSVLLQGLMLQSPQHWPNHLSPAFRAHHARWLEELRKDGLSPLSCALGFVRACEGVEGVLIGVLSTQELDQILRAWSQQDFCSTNAALGWAWSNEFDLDPRRWPRK